MTQRQDDDPPIVRSLGLLSVGETSDRFVLHRDELLDLSGRVSEVDRAPAARYLRQGTIVFAAMEHTKDVVENAFETPGGSGILTDGNYYWRRDAADYVEEYGTELPVEFLESARRREWRPPEISPQHLMAIDRFLMNEHQRP